MQCPFIYAKIECDDAITKVKQPELRITCFEDGCPIKIWEPKKTVGSFTMGGHCSVIVNICEQCETLHKCKKTGESKDECRQQRIDNIFRKGNNDLKPEPGQQVSSQKETKNYRSDNGGFVKEYASSGSDPGKTHDLV